MEEFKGSGVTNVDSTSRPCELLMDYRTAQGTTTVFEGRLPFSEAHLYFLLTELEVFFPPDDEGTLDFDFGKQSVEEA